MTVNFESFAHISALTLPDFDNSAADAARARQDSLTKPQGSLGRLEDLAVFMAGWQESARPTISRAQAVVFAGNHGVCAQGVNPYPQSVTAQMVANFEAGGSRHGGKLRAALVRVIAAVVALRALWRL